MYLPITEGPYLSGLAPSKPMLRDESTTQEDRHTHTLDGRKPFRTTVQKPWNDSISLLNTDKPWQSAVGSRSLCPFKKGRDGRVRAQTRAHTHTNQTNSICSQDLHTRRQPGIVLFHLRLLKVELWIVDPKHRIWASNSWQNGIPKEDFMGELLVAFLAGGNLKTRNPLDG